MQTPYIHSSEREFVQQPAGLDNQRGVTYKEVSDEHAIWAARAPFLPSLAPDDLHENLPSTEIEAYE